MTQYFLTISGQFWRGRVLLGKAGIDTRTEPGRQLVAEVSADSEESAREQVQAALEPGFEITGVSEAAN